MKDLFTGVGVALITPFNDDLSVDYDALKALLITINEGNVDYLVVNLSLIHISEPTRRS